MRTGAARAAEYDGTGRGARARRCGRCRSVSCGAERAVRRPRGGALPSLPRARACSLRPQAVRAHQPHSGGRLSSVTAGRPPPRRRSSTATLPQSSCTGTWRSSSAAPRPGSARPRGQHQAQRDRDRRSATAPTGPGSARRVPKATRSRQQPPALPQLLQLRDQQARPDQRQLRRSRRRTGRCGWLAYWSDVFCRHPGHRRRPNGSSAAAVFRTCSVASGTRVGPSRTYTRPGIGSGAAVERAGGWPADPRSRSAARRAAARAHRRRRPAPSRPTSAPLRRTADGRVDVQLEAGLEQLVRLVPWAVARDRTGAGTAKTSPSVAGGQIGELAQGGAVADGRCRRTSSGSLRRVAEHGCRRTAPMSGLPRPWCRWNAASTWPATRSALPGAVTSTSIWARLRVPAGVLGEVVLHAGEQHLQGDRPGHRDRDAADHAGRRAAAQLQPADGQLPGHRAAARAGRRPPRRPRAAARYADQQQHDTAGDQVLVEVARSSLPLPIIGASSARPATGSSSRHHSRRRGGPRGAHHAERFDDHAAQREQRHQRPRPPAPRRRPAGRAPGTGVRSLGEDADVRTGRRRARELPADQEERRCRHQPEHRAGQRLAGRDPPGHPAVRADQPQRREPPVAALAAEPHGRGDEDRDRQQQHHEDDDDEQQQDRVRAPRGLAARVAEPLDAGDVAVAAGVPCEVVGAGVVGEFARARSGPRRRSCRRSGTAAARAAARRRRTPSSFFSAGETHHLARRRAAARRPGGSGARAPSGCSSRPADVRRRGSWCRRAPSTRVSSPSGRLRSS